MRDNFLQDQIDTIIITGISAVGVSVSNLETNKMDKLLVGSRVSILDVFNGIVGISTSNLRNE